MVGVTGSCLVLGGYCGDIGSIANVVLGSNGGYVVSVLVVYIGL